jgi:hypothetical protein
MIERLRRAKVALASGRVRDPVLRLFATGSVGAEIGVYRGDFSARIMKVVQPKHLHLIDPWHFEGDPTYARSWYGGRIGGSQEQMDSVYRGVMQRFRGPIDAGVVTVHRAPSSAAARAIPPGSLDWAYIDGNHLYDYVREDLELYWERVRPGGIVAGDDYAEAGWWEAGVKHAVDEFAAKHGGELLLLDGGQFVLRRGA